MRQAGYLAAAGIYALDHHINRLREDHQRAKALGDTLKELPYVTEILPIETNIVVYRLADDQPLDDYLQKLETAGLFAVPFGPQTVRLVTHLDFGDDALEQACSVLKSVV